MTGRENHSSSVKTDDGIDDDERKRRGEEKIRNYAIQAYHSRTVSKDAKIPPVLDESTIQLYMNALKRCVPIPSRSTL